MREITRKVRCAKISTNKVYHMYLCWKELTNMEINVGSILASVTMITIVSLTQSSVAKNFLDHCSGIKNTTRETYDATDEWLKLGQLYAFCAKVCYNIFLCRYITVLVMYRKSFPIIILY